MSRAGLRGPPSLIREHGSVGRKEKELIHVGEENETSHAMLSGAKSVLFSIPADSNHCQAVS